MITHKGEPVTKCPRCGHEGSYYASVRMSGRGDYFYNFDGTVSDNTPLHDCLKYTMGKIAYCSNCNKRLGKLVE